MDQSDWQLEMLCNLGASEILMPVGSFPELAGKDLSIDQLMELRKEYDVSAEAILMRVVRLTEVPAIVFAASRIESGSNHGAYRIDYAISSRRAALNIARGLLLPESTVLKECTAIGFTAKGKESWPGVSEELSVEGVGVPPYPDRRFPRVVGLALLPKASARPLETIKYLRGDATEPRGTGPRLIAQIVNDRTPRWGGGFAQVIKKKWPRVQEEFIRWADVTSENLKLGRTHRSEVMDGLAVFSMVSQHGYGESPTPRIRYRALQECLKQLAEDANSLGASVHMPRIGCGEARGSWDVIGELIVETLSRAGITVTVYDLPNAKQEAAKQKLLFQ
jgi:O-acetyl-ADP-ribose deacetylase (regulator of RNase III)